jgi:hypothetical protein
MALRAMEIRIRVRILAAGGSGAGGRVLASDFARLWSLEEGVHAVAAQRIEAIFPATTLAGVHGGAAGGGGVRPGMQIAFGASLYEVLSVETEKNGSLGQVATCRRIGQAAPLKTQDVADIGGGA